MSAVGEIARRTPAAYAAETLLAAGTIFLGAFLLFAVQPLIAKLILPWFGGAAGVWIACLLFFQAALLAGYAYAHLLVRKVASDRQWCVHAGLLALSLLSLPIVPADAWKPAADADPLLRILVLLTATIGLPFILLAATSPLVQAWMSRGEHRDSVYRFYALSNFGSLLALLSYPVLVEPWLSARMQAWIWSCAYLVFAVLCAALAYRCRNASLRPVGTARDDVPPADRLLWLILAAVPSALLLAVTHHMLRNVAAMPLLWVLPLALYLLSMILCFDSPRWFQRAFWYGAYPGAVGAMILAAVAPFLFGNYGVQLALYSAAFFVCCMICHGELAARKPSACRLTSYYLTIAAGGALGGVSIAALAPLLSDHDNDLAITLLVLTVIIAFVAWRLPKTTPRWVRLNGMLLLVGAWPVLLFVTADPVKLAARQSLFAGRNFYGPLQVHALGRRMLELQNGSIVHGRQFTAPAARCRPLSYYAPASGIGAAIAAKRHEGPLYIGVVGLGAGTIAGYGRAGDVFRFYEINPLVRAVATETFSYLRCGGRSGIVMGDARLSLEREAPNRFDILAVDAFTSDAIPVHLLTREAFALYWRHLEPDGVLALHISNTFVDLAPVVARVAAETGKPARIVSDPGDPANGVSLSVWVLVAGDPAFFAHQDVSRAKPLHANDTARVWTDDYSNLWRVIRW